MFQEIVSAIKSNRTLYRFAKLIYDSILSPRLPVYFLLDPASIMNKWYSDVKKTQINQNVPLFIDRMCEIEAFFDITRINLIQYFIKYGSPNSDKFKEKYLQAFEGSVSPAKLKGAYDCVAFDYTIRLMLAYERYSYITGYLDYMISHSGLELKDFVVLDYGCGVADISLLFSMLGAEVTICDLDNQKFDFVLQRFQRRGFNPQTIRIKDTEKYPELPVKKYNLIIATELFEHVRNPYQLVRNFASAVKPGGYILDSMAGEFHRDDRPHHLKEAFQIGQSDEYQAFYKQTFKHIDPGPGLHFLFQKRLRN
jgi:2-polyprenyl-3-methyl-5-hydroxy-6-metoxy-1,4-benzoquinol methylase